MISKDLNRFQETSRTSEDFKRIQGTLVTS